MRPCLLRRRRIRATWPSRGVSHRSQHSAIRTRSPRCSEATLAAVGAVNAAGIDPPNDGRDAKAENGLHESGDVGQPALVSTGVHYIARQCRGGRSLPEHRLWTTTSWSTRGLCRCGRTTTTSSNDLWELSWPATEDLPNWRKVEVDIRRLPAPRWWPGDDLYSCSRNEVRPWTTWLTTVRPSFCTTVNSLSSAVETVSRVIVMFGSTSSARTCGSRARLP